MFKRRPRRRFKRRTRASAASSIQAAWRRRRRRRRGGLIARTAASNMRAIKKLKTQDELKFTNNSIATSRTMWCGQVLSNITCDSTGYPSDTTTYVAAGPAGTQLPDSDFLPLVQQPWVIPQAGYVQPNQTPPATAEPSGEGQRIGNWVKHVNTTFKLTLTGSRCDLNGGDYRYVAQKQSMRIYFVLDREPSKPADSLNTAVPTFDVTRIPARLYGPTSADSLVVNNAASGLLNANLPGFDNLRSGPRILTGTPPGITTGCLSTVDLHGLSYYSKDNVGAKNRFKILKVIEMHCNQQDTAVNPDSGSRPAATHQTQRTVTIKAPWKLHWSSNSAFVPDNYNLLVFYSSNTPTAANALSSPPLLSADYVAAPSISCVARVQFRDA